VQASPASTITIHDSSRSGETYGPGARSGGAAGSYVPTAEARGPPDREPAYGIPQLRQRGDGTGAPPAAGFCLPALGRPVGDSVRDDGTGSRGSGRGVERKL
jgi:hypothetical protein